MVWVMGVGHMGMEYGMWGGGQSMGYRYKEWGVRYGEWDVG